MIVVLTGAPGAGKGTQAEKLADECGYTKVSTGDALRKHVKLGTPIGKQAAEIMNRGELVPDEILLQIVQHELEEAGDTIVLLDGYPRNVAQALTLETLEKTYPVKAAIHLDVDREQLIQRLSGRRVCTNCGATYHVSFNPPAKEGVCDECGGALNQRADDKPESIAKRLDVYQELTAPVLDFYKNRGLYQRVDGDQPADQVLTVIKSAIGELNT